MDMTVLFVLTTGMLMQSSETTATDSIRDNLKILARNQDDHRILLQSLSSQVRDHGVRLTKVENRVMNVKDTWVITINTISSSTPLLNGCDTNDDVILEIRGDRGISRNLKIEDRLEAGQIQNFTFANVKDVGNVHSLRVEKKGNDGWCFLYIKLKKNHTDKEYTFYFNNTLDGNDPKYKEDVILGNPGPGMCEAVLHRHKGNIKSPGLFEDGTGKYLNNLNCDIIISVDTGYKLKFNATEFDLQECNNACSCDNLQLFDGKTDSSQHLTGKLCGSDKPTIHDSNSNEVLIRFKTDSSTQKKGFSIDYSTEDIDECLNKTFCNGGKCTNEVGSFTCDCDGTGFTGARCDIDIDECKPQNPCQNNGVCINTVGSFFCDCNMTGFIGPTCTDGDEWQVLISTGNHSCTDGIQLQIRGDKFSSRQLRITLDTRATHTFIFNDIIDVGNVHSLRLELLGHDSCFVGNITLRNARTKDEYTFNFYDFLDINKQVVIVYPDCPMEWIYLKASNICVKDIGRKGNYATAVYECSENGGHLPEPHNYKENAQIAKFAGKGAFTWIGISEFVEGEWRYQSDNRSVKYANWATGRPLNWLNMTHCGVLVNDLDLFVTQGRWYDRSCLEIYPIMCSRVKDFNECLAKPCLHNGTCSNTVGSFTCDCQNTGYTGTLCEKDIDECLKGVDSEPACKHGGVCTNTNGSFICDCAGTGYEGNRCENDVNECDSSLSPCKHNGTCLNTVGNFTCKCDVGYSGATCENDIDECKTMPAPCNDHGNCTNTDGNFTCDCECAYTGDRCETARPNGEKYTFEHADICYALVSEKKTWTQAKDYCVTIGGFLAEPKTDGQNTFIKDTIWDKNYAWIGASDSDVEGVWIWSMSKTQIPASYLETKWHSGEPNDVDSNQDCLCLGKKDENGRVWFDGACSSALVSLCQLHKN